MTEAPGSKRPRLPDDAFNDDHPRTESPSAPPLKKRKTDTDHESVYPDGQRVPYEEYVARNILRSLDDEQVSDVTFVVEHEHFGGIRALFAAQSAVFRRMLYGGMAESNPSNEVILSDVSIAAFKYLRSSFYNLFSHERAVKLDFEMVVDVLFAAHQYMIAPLVEKCIAFIKRIQNMHDWFSVLREFEHSHCQHQANLFLSQIVSEGSSPYILQYKSVPFLQNEQFARLRCDTVVAVIRSDYLSAREHAIWDSLIRWTKHNAVHAVSHNHNHNHNHSGVEQKDENEHGEEHKNADTVETELDRKLAPHERALIATFLKHVRFKRMDAAYFKQHIVDNQILGESQVIQVMFCREDGSKWSSQFNDHDRQKCKMLDSFELSEVCLTLPQIQALSVGDLVDFRDKYGLFCAATVIATDHSLNRVKMRYNEWGTRYDEWYTYKKQLIIHGDGDEDDADAEEEEQAANEDEEEDDDDDVAGISDLFVGRTVKLSQSDMCSRFARFGSVSKRNIKRQGLKDQISEFQVNGGTDIQVQVKPSMLFWKQWDDRRGITHEINIDKYRHKWLGARLIEYQGYSLKYSHHIKVSVEIRGHLYRWWVHPDSAQEIRPIDTTD